MQKTNLKDKLQLVEELKENWCLVTSKNNDQVNTLTASWGTFGQLWNKDVVTIYLRPTRYTKEFIDNSHEFTLSFFEGYQPDLLYLGRNSGREIPNKIDQTNLHLTQINDFPTYQEAKLVLTCQVLYCQQFQSNCFINKTVENTNYPNQDYSYMYIAEITAVYENK